MKVMFRNWYEKGYWQICILPALGIFKNEGRGGCFYLGWLFFVVEVWWGDIEDLV